MVYCMSDIHGEYDRYMAMLDLIQFSEQDTLYILGDVIDRKPDGIEILQDIMNTDEIISAKASIIANTFITILIEFFIFSDLSKSKFSAVKKISPR